MKFRIISVSYYVHAKEKTAFPLFSSPNLTYPDFTPILKPAHAPGPVSKLENPT